MNTSSLSSKNNNSFSLLSLNSSTHQPCCPHQQQYTELYQELSSLRIEYRSVKHENSALRSTNKGMEEENTLLKQFLNNKKEIVKQLNHQLENSQKEIDRLEDQLGMWQEEKKIGDNAKEELNKVTAENANLKELLQRESKKCGTLEMEVEKIRKEQKQKVHEIQTKHEEMIKNMTKTLQKAMETKIFELKNFGLTIQKEQESIRPTKLNLTTGKIPVVSQDSISHPIQNNLKTLMTSLEQHQKSFSEILTKKDIEIQTLKHKSVNLESQLSSSLELINEQTCQMSDMRRSKEEVQRQKQVSNAVKEDQRKEKDKVVGIVVRQLSKILKEVLPESSEVVEKLVSSIVTSNNLISSKSPLPQKIETQILLSQLQTISSQSHTNIMKTTVQNHQFQRLSLDHTSLVQTHDFLSLKYETLYRQYQHVMEDNARLIKYNGLTKYRINRNLSNLRESPKEEQQRDSLKKTPWRSSQLKEWNKQNQEKRNNL